MSKDATLEPPGSIPALVSELRDRLRAGAGLPTWTLGSEETRAALVEISQLRAQVDELAARTLAHAIEMGAGEEVGAASTANWLSVATRQTRSSAHRQARVAVELRTHPRTRDAAAQGTVLAEQAEVITHAVDQLSEGTPPDDVDACERYLIEAATRFDATALRRLGRRLVEVIDPDGADAHEAALLEAEAAAVEKKVSLTLRDQGDGSVRGSFVLPVLEAAQLKTALLALAAPKSVRAHGGDYDHRRPTHHRLGQAFREYVSRFPADALPEAGGVAATIAITMDLDTLLGAQKAATLGDLRIAPGDARRLACEAGLVPAVLGTASEVLDLGRTSRFHNKAQRLALAITQKTCVEPGCDVPHHLCHVHHRDPWSRGGRTDLARSELRCPRHHRDIHRQPPQQARPAPLLRR